MLVFKLLYNTFKPHFRLQFSILGIALFLVLPFFVSCDNEGNGQDINPQQCKREDDICLSLHEVSLCGEDGRRRSQYCATDELCYAGVCGKIVCEANKISHCLENGKYHGCNPVGTGHGDFDCYDKRTCVDGECVPRFCSEGEGRCADDDILLLCNEAGTKFSQEHSCRAENPRTSCVDDACVSLCEQNKKQVSYIGCEYWAVDLDNAIDNGVYDAAGQPYAVVLSNTRDDISANVSIYDKAGYSAEPRKAILSFEIPAHELRKVYLPDGCYDGGKKCQKAYQVNGTNISEAAFYILSDIPITAAQFNPLDNVNVFSNDASLLLPSTALGKRYMTLTRKQHYDSLRAFVTVVAVEPGKTEVSFTSSCNTLSGLDKNNKAIPAMTRGQTQRFVLEQFDVLNIETGFVGDDLTGSNIVASQNVAVFAGSEATSVPETDPVTCCADHLEQQLYPLQSWGMRYNAVRTIKRNSAREMWRILARMDNTRVSTTPRVVDEDIVLNAGQWIDILTEKSFEIEANSPILVGQFSTGQNDPLDSESFHPTPDSAGIGDPAYILLAPIEQYRRVYSFLVPSKYKNNYITIVAPRDASIVLDGETLDREKFKDFGKGEYIYAWLELEEGRHGLSASEPVGLYVYGFDRAVAYGYPAGLDLKPLFE
ncbi:MAG: IgGFc-binding protein [Bradymonadales bacterium]|jgi:hypothetical protein